MPAYIYIHRHAYIHIQVYACIHTYTYIDMPIYMHTQEWFKYTITTGTAQPGNMCYFFVRDAKSTTCLCISHRQTHI